MIEARTIEDVEAELQRAQERINELSNERQDIDATLEAKGSADNLLDAALSGKTATTTPKVAKLRDRRTEIEGMLSALDNYQKRLELQRVMIRSDALEEEIKAASEVVAQKREVEQEATRERQQAENEVAARRDETYTLREQRLHLESLLWERDPAYREEVEAEVQRRHEENALTPEQAEAYRRQLSEQVFGQVTYSPQRAEEVARQGGKLIPWSRGVQKVWPGEE
jgi:chromosome segregation ATPase